MADVKITALTALTAADPANDVIPIVDVSDTTMAASGTTKKISVNNILSSSPTASGALTVTGLVTAGSATITGALTVDTTTLVVDATNDRVGIGTAGPAVPLQVKKDGVASGAGWTAIGRFHNVAETKGVDIGYNPANNNAVITALSGGIASGFEFWSFDSGWATRATLNSTGLYISNGNVVMSTSGKGIDFSATTPDGSGTVTSELLDDYEEGTFTPTFTASAGTPTTVTLVSAAYTKIGRRVSVDVDFFITAIGTASGNLYLTLPFSQSTASTPCGAFVEVSVVGYMGAIFQFDATRAGMNFYNNATTWVNGYRYRGTYTYNV